MLFKENINNPVKKQIKKAKKIKWLDLIEKDKNFSPLMLKNDKPLKKIGRGIFSNVYEWPDGKWVVKIGQVERVHIPIVRNFSISLLRKTAAPVVEKILGKTYALIQNKEKIRNDFLDYKIFRDYLGFDDENRAEQEKIRKKLMEDLSDKHSIFYRKLSKSLSEREISELKEIFKEQFSENFLKREFLAMGYPPGLTEEKLKELKRKNEKIPVTYYIFQEKVTGNNIRHLFEIKDKDIKKHPLLAKRLITLVLLIKNMEINGCYLPDTRPEEPVKHPLSWFRKTSNILIDLDKEKVFFIDTRLLWNKKIKSPIGGKMVRFLESRSLNRSLKRYLGFIESSHL